MRYVSIDAVEPGHILARTIYTSDGMALLNQSVQLTVGMISTLRRLGVTAVYLQDPNFADIKIEDVVSEQTRRESLSVFSGAVQCVQSGKEMSGKEVSTAVSNIIDEILRNKKVLVGLSDIRTRDNAIFLHALNVCMLSTVIGVNLSFNRNQLQELAIGALLHDIGKCEIPKQEREEEDREMEGNPPDDQTHTWRGYKRLRKKGEFGIVISHVALQHHEALDGTGYPRALEGDAIHRYAKIVAVANWYDNLISGVYNNGKQMMPHEAVEHLMGLAGNKLDYEMVLQFTRSVAVYPTGTSVRLDTGVVGVVVAQHKGLPTRPVVRMILKEANWNEPQYKELDLATATTIFIKNVMSD